jgi:hypothetical protein
VKTILAIVCVTLCLASTALAADVTGTWTGTLLPDGNANADTVLLTIRQEDDKVTGSAGPNPTNQFPLTGSVKDDRFIFEVRRNETRVISFDLQIKGDQMTGRAEFKVDGQLAGTAAVTVKREPAKTQN